MSYTKGKWYWINETPGTEEAPKLWSDTGDEVCDFGDNEQYYPSAGIAPSDADMKLIAAAPEMLEALLKLQDVINRAASQNCVHAIETDEVNMINAAIAKAVQP